MVVERKEEGNFVAFKTRRVEFISLLKCFEDSLQKADTLDGTIFFSQPLTFGDCMIVVVVSIFLNFFFFVSFFFFVQKTSTFSFAMKFLLRIAYLFPGVNLITFLQVVAVVFKP